MALPLKHLLPSRDTALHASWITLTVLVLLLSAAVLMTMGRLKEAGAYWQVLVEVALVLLAVQWLLTATWVRVGTRRGPWTRQAVLTPLAWLSVTSALYVYAAAQMINRLIPTMGTIAPHATTGAPEGAAFLTLCTGFSICLATMAMVTAHLCYLCIRHRRTIG